ncbi:hypothetical protein [Hydrogenophaga sp.]|uniref:hypothetical protein n=1 Tax=Hydrogenophaga sp. TaxID=1904254 RepID=UPI0027227C5C|nr:hypothetical protein [Hydrogenophaga sp.]MDO9436713.1 hypothetical protein [Hydrogenophaga sp.]
MKRAKPTQAPSSLTAPITGITTTTKTTAAPTSQSIELAGKVCDQVMELLDRFKAYIAIERFVATNYIDEEGSGVQPSRSELGSLLLTLNEEIVRRLTALADLTAVQQAQLTIDAAQAR